MAQEDQQGYEMKYLIALLAFFSMQTAFAQSIGGSPYIAVHGKATMEAVPDIFPLEITLKETSKDTAASQERIESLAQAIVDLTRQEGVADADVNVGNLSVSPEFEYDEDTEKQVFTGNKYEREIEVRFHSLEKLRQFMAKIPKADQIRLDTGSFQYSKAKSAKKDLLDRAIADARATADEMSKGVGKRISGVHTISNQGFNVRYAESTSLDSVTVQGTALLAPGSVVLKEGRITLDQDVYIIYLLAD